MLAGHSVQRGAGIQGFSPGAWLAGEEIPSERQTLSHMQSALLHTF